MRSGSGERGVKCNVLILNGLRKRGVSKTDTPLLCNRLYFNVLQFTLEIESRARTTAAAGAGFAGGRGKMAAKRWVTKEVRSGEIGFSGTVRKNNFLRAAGAPPTCVGDGWRRSDGRTKEASEGS